MRSSSRHSSRLQNRQWVVPENASAHGAPLFGAGFHRPAPPAWARDGTQTTKVEGILSRNPRHSASPSLVSSQALERAARPWGHPGTTGPGRRAASPLPSAPVGGGVGFPTWTGCPVVTGPRMPRQRCERHAVAAHGSRAARSYQGTEPSCAYLLPPAATRVAASLGGN